MSGKLQQPLDEQVTVRMIVEPRRDPDLLRWLDEWIQKLLNDTGTPEEGPRS